MSHSERDETLRMQARFVRVQCFVEELMRDGMTFEDVAQLLRQVMAGHHPPGRAPFPVPGRTMYVSRWAAPTPLRTIPATWAVRQVGGSGGRVHVAVVVACRRGPGWPAPVRGGAKSAVGGVGPLPDACRIGRRAHPGRRPFLPDQNSVHSAYRP